LNRGQDLRRNPEAGLAQASYRRIEIDQPGLFGLIEHGEGAGNLESAARRFLSSCLLIHEQQFDMHLGRQGNRLAFSNVELRNVDPALGRQNLQPARRIRDPVTNRLRRGWMLQLIQDGRWNENSLCIAAAGCRSGRSVPGS